MAFDLQYFGELAGGSSKGQTIQYWAYSSNTDGIFAMHQPGYFNDVAGRVQQGDIISCLDVDGLAALFAVTSITGDTTITTNRISNEKGSIRSFDRVTWSGSGDTLSHPDTLVGPTDHVIASWYILPTEPSTLSAAAGTGTVNFALTAANTSDDGVIEYFVIRN